MSGTGPVVTFANDRYFIGVAGLVNSLHVIGHRGGVIVVDTGLTPDQAQRLSAGATVLPIAGADGSLLAHMLKPAVVQTVRDHGVRGPIALADCDLVITGDLGKLFQQAADGHLCMPPDGPPRVQGRRFQEWLTELDIEGPLRPMPYLNAGLMVFDPAAWEDEFAWWSRRCVQVAERGAQRLEDVQTSAASEMPFAYADQDILNAMLMTEVAPERIHILEWWQQGIPEPEDTTRIEDRRTIRCRSDYGPVMLVHNLTHPKPWLPHARVRLRYAPYEELLARLLDADDLPVRVPRSDIPAWLRDDPLHRIERRARRGALRPARWVRHTLLPSR
ncbi:MAG: hypothetical protein R2878_14315 [Thermoleophilia bacterium]